MTSIRESLKRLLGRQRQQETSVQDQPEPHYAYRIFWTKNVRTWTPTKRQHVLRALEDLMNDDEFTPNPFLRRFQLSQIDDSKHAGASLVALKEVIKGFNDFEDEEKEINHE